MPQTIRRVLVANRGEIAVRVIRACKELGLETIAVYSEADRDSLHVQMADRAVCIGSSSASKSYLDMNTLMSTALVHKADAIHPGYGFLSENAAFAALCEKEKVKFVGPSSDTIRAMGDKVAARSLAERAGVPTTPGSTGAVADYEDAKKIADKIGYPVLLKASAGGGGRGMRVVERAEELSQKLREAMAEAQSAFGNPAVYIEKYMTNIRHIEIQILGDGKDAIHIGERDCSTQRRNQKLIEESPSSVLDKKVREAMAQSAVDLCRTAKYSSAGTIEFIYDQDSNNFYFIEMNTRIQVEHPVTEVVAGIDLVKHQFEIAESNSLSLRQKDIVSRGHAIEFRINAEDFEKGFMPSPGRIESVRLPGGPGIRVDTHIYPGYSVPPFYDSLIAKLICFGVDRREALARASRALGELKIEGIKTTIPFHQKIISHPAFRSGAINTRFVHTEMGL
jgi:acetyl-CoA carboxylase, biotin carboxylase subunit